MEKPLERGELFTHTDCIEEVMICTFSLEVQDRIEGVIVHSTKDPERIGRVISRKLSEAKRFLGAVKIIQNPPSFEEEES